MCYLFSVSNFKCCDSGSVFILESKSIETILFSPDDKPTLKSNSNSYNFDKIVIACGAFSKKFTDQASEKIPLDTERGYHVHFKDKDHLLSRPVIFLNRGFAITPMEQGLRVVGTVEFGGFRRKIDGFEANQRASRIQRHQKRSEMITECFATAYGA